MYQITHRDQNDTQNAMKIHNDWLRPARHLNRCCIENKIIITKKNAHRICNQNCIFWNWFPVTSYFPSQTSSKSFQLLFEKLTFTRVRTWAIIGILTCYLEIRVLNQSFGRYKCCCTNYHWLQQYFVAPNNYFVGRNCIGRRLVYKTHRLMKSIVLNQYIR